MFDEAALVRVGAWLQQTGYRFITVTPASHARVTARRGPAEAQSLRDIFGWSLPFRPSLLPSDIFSSLERGGVLEDRGGLWRSNVRFSTLRDSLYMHSAYPTAESDAVFFGPDTYRFAALIERTLATVAGASVGCVVDVGCGGGAGGIVAVKALKAAPARCILADINPAALRYARVNVTLAGMPRASVRQGDLFQPVTEPIEIGR